MQVVAFSTPSRPEWRWRIVSYAGDMVEESHETFSSIGTAVAEGTRRMNELGVQDLSARSYTFLRSTSHLRSR
jgi:hypothetical protein